MKPGLLFLLFVAGCLSTHPLSAQSTNRNSIQPTNTPLPAATIPAQADLTKNFQVQRGFRLELAASDALVTAPVAMAFDENGRLFTLELVNRPAGGAVTGRVRVLEDNDGNGIFDSSAVYADNIANPTALICYGGGVFVAAAGRILYFKDSAGNGAADVQREVFKSFGDPGNGANGLVNITALAWGLDNRIHVATGDHGGDVISSSSPAQSVVLTDGSFSFDPRTFLLSAESGSDASGICFDDRGRRFICGANGSVRVVMYEPRYKIQNPFYTLPRADWNVSGPPAARFVYPAGASAPIRISSASSIVIYGGNAFSGFGAYRNLFIADAADCLVHRDILAYDGLQATLQRPADEPTSEFLSSTDQSFQPAQIINGPDGTLFIAGLLRVPQIAVRTNLISTAALPKGRIFRALPLNFKQPKQTELGKLSGEQLVNLLRLPNAWDRETASRLLYEHQERAAIVPLIRLLFDPQAPALARLHALCALDGIGLIVTGRPTRALLESHLLRALNDSDERVRERAVLLSEKFLSKAGTWSDALWGQLSGMGTDTSAQVRWQLTLTLGQSRNEGRVQTLANLARTDLNTRQAVLSSLKEGAAQMFDLAANDPAFRNSAPGKEFVLGLLSIVGKKTDPAETARVLATLQNVEPPGTAFELAMALANSVAQQDASLEAVAGPNAMNPLFAKAAALALDPDTIASVRAKAIRLLAMRRSVDASIAIAQVRRWPYQDKLADRQALLGALLSRPEWIGTVLNGIQSGLIPREDLSVEQIRFLLVYPNANVQAQAAGFFNGWVSLNRLPVLGRYRGAVTSGANAERGHALFVQSCQSCHYTGESTVDHTGLELNDARGMTREKLLAAILNPNGNARTSHPLALVQTKNGELLPGFVTAQGPKSLSICDWQGNTREVALSNIAAQTRLPLSAMPESWENSLTPQDMSDLLEYLSVGRGKY